MDVSSDILDKGFHLYFGNYFYSPSLLSDLLARDTYCIDTMRAHRNISLSLGNNINKLERGSFRRLSSLFCLEMQKPVALVNTICDVHDFAAVKRKHSDGSFVFVECPSAVVLCYDNMGGVDLADQNTSCVVKHENS